MIHQISYSESWSLYEGRKQVKTEEDTEQKMYWQYKRVHINDITILLSTLLLHLLQYEPCTEIRSQAVYYKETHP